MTRRARSKPKIAVVGLGGYYSKLKSGLSEYFDCVALLDSRPDARDTLNNEERSLFRACYRPDDLPRFIEAVDLVLILTPSHFHVPYALQAIGAGKPTVIEKPIAVSTDELESLRKEVAGGARLYCSDFYVDARAIPLLAATGHLGAGDWQVGLIKPGGLKVQRIEIGKLERIEGRIAEDYGFPFGTWAGKKRSGGVIFEMMVHLFALLKRLYPDESITVVDSQRLYANRTAPRGTFCAAPAVSDLGEAFARVDGNLTLSNVPVSFEVLKQAYKTDRYFKLIGSQGSITQYFKPEHPLRVIVGSKATTFTLRGDRYDLTSLAIRKWFDSGATPYGLQWSAWAAEQSIACRNWQAPATREQALSVGRPSAASEGKVNEGRRRFLIGGGALALNSFMLALNSFLIGANTLIEVSIHKESTQGEQPNVAIHDLQKAADKTERLVDTERIAAISRFVGASERLILAPGTEHLDARSFRGRGYPHDLSALAPFRHVIRGPILDLDVETIREYVRSGDIIVGTGSPTSSFLTKQVMAPGAWLSEILPYRLEEIPGDKFVRVVSGMLGGKEESKRGKRLIDVESGKELFTDEANVTDTGWLKRDILVVSRVPSGYPDCDLLLVSGGHGAGTQAIELLFEPSVIPHEDIEELGRRLHGKRYWQFVFEVNDIHHEIGFMSVAHSARLRLRDCPPKAFDPSLALERRATIAV